ncbi:MAG: PD-(D/E)XK nuclease family protein, partial [Verrucomicrobia bacterium]|nr:PD-(D/E)XK nuclease family protein [Verrucomicrobiota bacterium]
MHREVLRSNRLTSYDELWDAFWTNLAKKEIISLIAAKKPEAAERLGQALRAWCEHLATVRNEQPGARSWREIIVTAEYQFDDTPIVTPAGAVSLVGRPDAVRLEEDGLVVIDYKLSRGSNLKTDLLQAIIYAALLHQLHPKLSFSAQLEYYEPRLHRIRQSSDQVLRLFREMVLPTLETIAKQGIKPEVIKVVATDDLSERIVSAYREYGIEVQVVDRREAPQLARYDLKLGVGVSFAQASRRATDLKLALALQQEPMISAGPGFVWFDVPKSRPDTVLWSARRNDPRLTKCQSAVAFAVGVNVAGDLIVADFSDPNTAHGLIAGSSGSGKSEFLKAVIATLVSRSEPDILQISLIDPKRVTFGGLGKSAYLPQDVLYTVEDALLCLKGAADDMESRYDQLLRDGFNKIADWIAAGKRGLPYHVIVFDEFADFINAGKKEKNEFERLVKLISAKGRAAGIHLLIATQRPDRDVITGQIKANLPFKVCLRVTNAINSKIVLDDVGAENLIGRGDLLYDIGQGVERAQSLFVPDNEFRA